MPKISAEARVSRRLRFRDLQVFLAVVECGSMGKAAAQLGTTQPSVSELISGLESTIGARLFDRNAQGVEPTLYGQASSKRAIAAFDELKQGLRDLEFLANPTIGEIRIGCPDSVAATILPTMITGFCRDFPGIALQFDQVPTPTLEVPGLHARKLDMVIAWLSVPKDQYGDNLNVEILLEDEVVAAAGRNCHWARRRKISPSDIADGPWTGAPPETMARNLLDNAFRAASLPVPKSEVTTFLSSFASTSIDCGRLPHGNAKVFVAWLIRPESAAHSSPTSRLSNSYCDGEKSDLEPSCGAFSRASPSVQKVSRHDLSWKIELGGDVRLWPELLTCQDVCSSVAIGGRT